MTATLPTSTTTSNVTTTATVNTTGRPQAAVLAATRVVVSFLFVLHGFQGLFGAFGGIDTQGGTVEFLSFPNWWGSMIHLVVGALVGLGLFSRVSALLCSGSMAYAYFVVHQPIALLPIPNGGEMAALYSWIFLLIAVLGPGAYAVDNLIRRRRA